MNSKIIALFAIVFIAQGIHSKAVNPAWGFQIVGYQPINPVLQPIVSEIQTRLTQLSSAAKSSIGQTVGLASRDIGLRTSAAKSDNKLLINNIEKNPAISKACITENKAAIDDLNKGSKQNLSFCSKNSQIQLKTLNQAHKQINQQVLVMQNNINTAVNQCTVMYPLENDTEALTACFNEKSSGILDEINELEGELLQTIVLIQSSVDQIVDMTSNCLQSNQIQLQMQANELNVQLETCNNSTASPI